MVDIEFERKKERKPYPSYEEKNQSVNINDVWNEFYGTNSWVLCVDRLTWEPRSEIKEWIDFSKYKNMDSRDKEYIIECLMDRV